MMTRMSCKRAEKLMPLYAAGDLPAGRQARAVAAHVAGCAPCAALAEEYGASRQWARAAADVPEFGEDFYEGLRAGVLERVNRDTRPAAPTRAASFFPALFAGRRLAYAASLALAASALALSLYFARDYTNQPRRDDVADTRPAAEVITPTPAHVEPTPNASVQQPTPYASPDERENAQPKHKRAGGSFKRTPTLRRDAPTPDAAAERVLTAASGASLPSVARRATLLQGIASPALREGPISVARIEIQTADPNIRIIWLTPSADDEPDAAGADRVDPER